MCIRDSTCAIQYYVRYCSLYYSLWSIDYSPLWTIMKAKNSARDEVRLMSCLISSIDITSIFFLNFPCLVKHPAILSRSYIDATVALRLLRIRGYAYICEMALVQVIGERKRERGREKKKRKSGKANVLLREIAPVCETRNMYRWDRDLGSLEEEDLEDCGNFFFILSSCCTFVSSHRSFHNERKCWTPYWRSPWFSVRGE